MTINDAKQDIPTLESLADEFCVCCKSDCFCSFYCDTIIIASKHFDRVQQAYARYDGDILKVRRYILSLKR